ncbi:hypothetical protein DdX_20927 [Ditylenchus destructor]|uniref:Uncharacterized protein n=1 Tax=Ditylenchus destructor TaxID=166010 RepID=A0AAD4QTB7_9BILA|nr:hypothetical protein DdX_20927 [Ditylenchus destructor]
MRLLVGVLPWFVLALPAAAQTVQPLFPVTDVDRDTVPAGTPEAFWAVFGESPRNEAERTVKGEKVTFVPLTLVKLPGEVTALVSTGASDCEAHACAGFNSVHYLRRDKAGHRYAKIGEWLDIGARGTWGNPAARWGTTDAITGTPVLYTQGGGTWQGYSCDVAVLTELGAKGPVEIARFPIYYSTPAATTDRPCAERSPPPNPAAASLSAMRDRTAFPNAMSAEPTDAMHWKARPG